MAPPRPQKGKRRPSRTLDTQQDRPIPQAAFIQAYEAQLVYHQTDLASELATPVDDLPESSRGRGRGLLRWQGDLERRVWADRHDMIHLLDSLPTSGPFRSHSRSPSPTGSNSSISSSWDSLPSDAEETFNISGDEEYEEHERQKRTKWLAALREDRLREREKEDRETLNLFDADRPKWQDNEEPPDAILTLMKHTAKSLFSSPNPQVLEMRILANHAQDERFAFLRGRYKDSWTSLKDMNRRKKMHDPARREKEEKAVGALLGGYESSDEEDDEDDGDDAAVPPVPGSPPPPPPPPPDEPAPPSPTGLDIPKFPPDVPEAALEAPGDGLTTAVGTRAAGSAEAEEAKRLRRAKVEEWKRKRAEALRGGIDRS